MDHNQQGIPTRRADVPARKRQFLTLSWTVAYVFIFDSRREVELNASEKTHWVIGRAADCDIRVERDTVSRTDSIIFFKDNAWFIMDLGSTNGVQVNDRLLTERRPLYRGDRIRLSAEVVINVS